MKKSLGLLLLILLLVIPRISNAQNQSIIIKIDGKSLNLEGVAPYIKDGTTFVPLRAISEALDYKIVWDKESNSVHMEKDELKVILPIGKTTANVNGKNKTMPQAASIINGTTYLPARFVSELIGYEVNFKNENGIININVVSPPVESKVDKNQADKFVSDYIKTKGYNLIEYKMGDITGDSIQDYVLLVDGKQASDNEIILIDGQKEIELARTTVMKGYIAHDFGIQRVTGENKKQIHYFADDGYGFRYIFNYTSNSLKDIYKEIEELNGVEGTYSYTYFIDYPTLNKVLTMRTSDKVVEEVTRGAHFNNPSPKPMEALGSKSYVEDMSTPGEIKVSYELKFFPTGSDSKASILHSYKWNNGKWELSSAKIESFDSNRFKVSESKYSNPNEYASWCKDGVLNITKDNVDKIFNASKNEILRICGKPKSIGTDYYAEDYMDYTYNGYVVRYLSGTDKYPWGPGNINFSGGNSTALGIKVGTSFKDVKNKLGKPSDIGDSEEDEWYSLIYTYNGYNFYFLGGNPNGKVGAIYVKVN